MATHKEGNASSKPRDRRRVTSSDASGGSGGTRDRVAASERRRVSSSASPSPDHEPGVAPGEGARPAADDRGASELDSPRRAAAAEGVHPAITFLVLGTFAVGGGLLVASMMRTTRRAPGHQVARGADGSPRCAALARAIGPKGTENLMHMRDALLSFALVKTAEKLNELFPGFHEHFESAR